MKLQILLCSLSLVLSGAFFSQTYADTTAASAQSDKTITDNKLEPKREHIMVARQVAALLDRNHYLQQPLDDEKSAQILAMYLDNLDASRIYFLQSDIDEFEKKYGSELDNMLKKGDLSAAFAIYQRFQERAQAFYEFADGFLAKDDINLESDDVLNTDREEAPYFTSEAEQQDYWRKQLTLQLININIAKREEKAKEAVFRENPELTKGQDLIRDDKRSPVEILQNRIDRQRGQLVRLKNDSVLEGILNAALGSYDPHSNYYAPVLATEINLQSNLALEGIGVSIRADRKNPDYTRIESVVEGGPAAKTGQVKAGELIIGVAQDGGEMVNVVGWSLREVVALIRGKRGTKVVIALIKSGAAESTARNVTIVRDVIEQEEQGVRERTFNLQKDGVSRKIGVLEIPSFYLNYRARRQGESYRSVSEDTEKALISLNEQGVDALVVDLRNNPGGSLDEVSKMLGLFIKQGPLVQIRDSLGNVQVFKDIDGGKQLFDKPMVVVINLASASASEIFAAAIQDYNRGIVVGSTTTGKGSAQVQLDAIAYGQMTLTQRKFYRVTGGSTQNKGVVPDIELVNIYDEELGERSQKHALEWDTIKTASFKPEQDFSAKLPELIRRSKLRQGSNPQFVYLQTLRDLRDQESEDDKHIVLNIDKRLQKLHEMEAQTLAAENARRKATGKPKFASWDVYQADLDAEAEARGSMKRDERPLLPEDEVFVIEAASILMDKLTDN